jgi:type 1 glutamine amidotransferase
MTTSNKPRRTHLITGGFPPGSPAGHDHDYARLRLLELLAEDGIQSSVANDFHGVERWLEISRFMITYTAGPFLDEEQNKFVRSWIDAGGRWLGLHGSSGGKAARVADSSRRRMVKSGHHETLGGFFISHPPMAKFPVKVHDADAGLTKGVSETFSVIDEPYMIEVQDLPNTNILLTSSWGADPLPGKFGFDYGDEDTSLLEDGKTRVVAYNKEVGDGGVTYIALGHCHNPSTNSQAFVDDSVSEGGKTPKTIRGPWETEEYPALLRNAIDWGIGD